jgi:hypothetical protein
MSILTNGKLNTAEIRALQMVEASLSDPVTLQEYNTMANINRQMVMQELAAWARNEEVSNNARNALAKALTIKTRSDFHAAMNRVTSHIKRWIALEPYAMIVEFDRNYRAPRGRIFQSLTAKSSVWLLAPVIRALGRPPAMIIPYFIHMDCTGSISETMMRMAIQQGIRSFVHVDDAMYSGDQKMRLMSGVVRVVSQNRTTLQSKQRNQVRNRMQARYGHTLGTMAADVAREDQRHRVTVRTSDGRTPRLLVATAFSTPHARTYIRSTPSQARNLLNPKRHTP